MEQISDETIRFMPKKLKKNKNKTQQTYSVEFVIFKDEVDCQPLLSLWASIQMGRVKIKQNFHRVAKVSIEKNYKEVATLQLN